MESRGSYQSWSPYIWQGAQIMKTLLRISIQLPITSIS